MAENWTDAEVRLAAFRWLKEMTSIHGEVLPRDLLAAGFLFKDHRVPLVGPQGIFKPRVIPEIPLSITTTLQGPYDDATDEEGYLLYRYRGTDPRHHENVGLRKAMFQKVPLVYFRGIVPGRYLALWPVFITGDSPEELTFRVAVDDAAAGRQALEGLEPHIADDEEDIRRRYLTASVRHREHQYKFRERVLRAYREQCALCRLRHRELLDAAHIIPDTEEKGEPLVSNGLSMCKIHHAAFDRHLIGIRPDYLVEVRRDILEEDDGPMLVHGLQEVHSTRILLPRSREHRPDPDRLAIRFDRFRAAS